MAPLPLAIHLFGPLRVIVRGAPLPRLRTRSIEWLLALLTLRHGRAVDRSWLAGTLWPESSERQTLANLRNDLVFLRRALGPEAVRLQSPARDALMLDLEGAEVDVLRFDAAIRAGDEESLRGAVEIYTGPLLEGCLEEWVLAERQPRAEQCLSALETLAERAEGRGAHPEAIGYLRRAEALDRLRDSVQQRLMASLAAAGDPTAAIQVYRDFRIRLQEELAAEPEEATTRLFHEIRAAARGRLEAAKRQPRAPITAGPARGFSPPESTASPLPRPLTLLIGRDRDVDEVLRHLRERRLVTLIGGGGVGKTRLALEVAAGLADEYPGRTAFVELAPLADPALLPGFVAAALGLHEPAAPESRDLVEALIGWLSEQSTLLVLDNCEHLIEAAAELAHALLEACPELRILATSRQRLGLTGEIAWRVPSLPSPDPEQLPLEAPGAIEYVLQFPAVQLFLERAAAVRPGFQLRGQEEALAVAWICRRLDGIPLALELAAARVTVLSVAQIAARLDDCFRLLTGGSRAALPRHQTLRALIDWSYDLLTDDERALLRRFSVFAGGWTLEAAEAVGSDFGFRVPSGRLDFGLEPTKTSDRPEPLPLSAIQNPKSKIQNSDVLDLLTSLVERSLVLAEEAGGATDEEARPPSLRGVPGGRAPGKGLRYRLLETIREDAAERLRESGEEQAARNRHLAWFLHQAQEAAPSLRGPAAEATVAGLNAEIGNLRAALAWAQTEAAPPEVLVQFVAALWPYWQRHGSLFEGCARVQAALDRCEDSESPVRAELLLAARALTYEFHFRQVQLAARSLPSLGDPTLWTSDHDRTTAGLEQALAIQCRLGQKPDMVLTLRCLRIMAEQQGDRARALSYLQEAVAIARELGNRIYLGTTLHEWGCVLYRCGAYEGARLALTEAVELFRQPGGEYGLAFGCNNLGMTLYRLGDRARAAELHREALVYYLREERQDGRESWDGIVWSLRELALTGMKEAEAQQAARLLGAASKRREEPGLPMDYWDRAIAPVRAVLGEETFNRAFEAGRALSREQAITQALEQPAGP